MAPTGTPGFLHGVASFDPTATAVIIWTRLTPVSPADTVAVDWEVSTCPDFSSIAASGTVATDETRDWTVIVDVTGLQPGQRYKYRFSSGKLSSVVGCTKTAGEGHLQELIFATVSCSNWAYGHFHVYDLLTKVDNLDFVMHCGDYIYEYDKGTYPSRQFMARHGLRPKHRCATLADYRQRYACYRTDPALQELHRRVPMIVVNDDHEIADDAHIHGSEDFEGSRREWEKQKFAAIQAFIEWVPVRGMSHKELKLSACHRTLQFGDLLTLMTVEGRVSNRSPPVDMPNTEFYRQTAKTDPKEWDDEAICAGREHLLKKLADPDRHMIGPQQLADVAEAVQESVAAGKPWQVLVSQTVFSPIKAPKLLETIRLQPRLLTWLCRKALGAATNAKKAGQEGAELARMYLGMGKYGLPMNPAAYDGYAAERDKLLRALGVEGANPVVLSGDSHNAWVHEILNEDGKRMGVEFAGPAVTSIGFMEDIYQSFVEKVGKLTHLFPLWAFTPWIEDALAAANPDTLRYCSLDQRGCVLFHVTHGKFHAEYHFVSSVAKKTYESHAGAVFEAEKGNPGRLKKAVRYLTIDGEIPRSEKPKRMTLLRATREISSHAPERW